MSELLQEGDVIEICVGHMIYAYVPKHFVYDNHKGDFGLTYHEVKINNQLDYLAGRYIVTQVGLSGGGHDRDGYMPDGHCVKCVKVDDGSKIGFYQTGSFSAMIEDIDPVGKAELTYKEIKGNENG